MTRYLIILVLTGFSFLYGQKDPNPDNLEELPQLPDTLAVHAGDGFRISEDRISVVSKETGLIGFNDRQGLLVIPCIFSKVGEFSEGKAFAAILHNTYMEFVGSNQVGYIDQAGEWVIRLPDSLANLQNGCYFHGEKFENGQAQMFIYENDGDCANWGSITVNSEGVIKEDWQ